LAEDSLGDEKSLPVVLHILRHSEQLRSYSELVVLEKFVAALMAVVGVARLVDDPS
jgi:hypothetical protein